MAYSTAKNIEKRGNIMHETENPLANVPDELIRELLEQTNIQNNRNFVMNAVKKRGHYLKYAKQDLKNDREIVMQAVKQDWEALQHASDELKDDYEIIVEALKQSKFAINWTSHTGNLDLLMPLASGNVKPGSARWNQVIEECEDEFRPPSGIHYRGLS